jgi:aspartate beta-hydroxylase
VASSVEEIRRLAEDAVAALQAGDNKRARGLFEQAVTLPGADTSVWLGLAFSCGNLRDNARALAAVDKSLQLDPQNIRANLFKGDHLEHTGESRKALEFFQIALRLAAQMESLPHDLQHGLQRAAAFCERLEGEYSDFLLQQLSNEGFTPGKSEPRFWRSLDVMLGNAEIFNQAPRRYYFPNLPQIQFYERESFQWLSSVEAATDSIRAELESTMAGSERFSPYLNGDEAHLSESGNELINNNDWGALYLWNHGTLDQQNADSVPSAIAALRQAPLPEIPGQAPMALFSRLKPHTNIPPHNGLLNTRLICHLPIIVPENCGALRVGNEQRDWEEGKTLIFDDSIEHEAWNHSDEERVVLLFEIWRPELSLEERDLVRATLEAVRRFHDNQG